MAVGKINIIFENNNTSILKPKKQKQKKSFKEKRHH